MKRNLKSTPTLLILNSLVLLLALLSQVFAGDLPKHESRGKVVFLAPHPDDDVLYSGVLFQALKRGAEVTVVYLSNGESMDSMAKQYLREKGIQLPKNKTDRIALYERIRMREARTGLASLERAAGGRPIRKIFLGLPSIGDALIKNPQPVLQTLAAEIGVSGECTVYVPHPRDTHPGHRATYDFLKQALENTPSAVRDRLAVYGYMVHFGSYAGFLGLSSNGTGENPAPLDFAMNKDALQEVPLNANQAVVKLDALLAHDTQISRDDVLNLGSPLLTGYLSGFVTVPEVLERLPSDPTSMPQSQGSLPMRGFEILYRYLVPRFGAYDQAEIENTLTTLEGAANANLPPGSRAAKALEVASIANLRVALKGVCERLLRGPVRLAGSK